MSQSWSQLFNQLQAFLSSSQWERVLEVGGRMLTIDPDQAWLHVVMGDAHRNAGSLADAEKHYRRAMALDPDDADPHAGMSQVELKRNRAGLADDHIHRALKIDPDNDFHWIIKAILAIHHGHHQEAESAALKALEINPDNLHAKRFLIDARAELPGSDKLSPQQQLDAYEDILAEDPENDSVISDIGVIYFNEFKDYQKAEEKFRQALRIDPSDKSYQKLLVQSLRKRDPVLRLLWIPFKPVEWMSSVLDWTWKKKWPLIFMIFLFKYVVISLVLSALIFFILCWPVSKVYEYLTIADIHRKAGQLRIYSGPMARIHKSPFALRFGAFLVVVTSFWTAVVLALRHEELGPVIGKYFAIVLGVCVVLFYILSWALTARDAYRKRAHARRSKRLKSS